MTGCWQTRLFAGRPGEAAGHDDDHGPTTHPAMEHHEALGSVAAFDDLLLLTGWHSNGERVVEFKSWDQLCEPDQASLHFTFWGLGPQMRPEDNADYLQKVLATFDLERLCFPL